MIIKPAEQRERHRRVPPRSWRWRSSSSVIIAFIARLGAVSGSFVASLNARGTGAQC